MRQCLDNFGGCLNKFYQNAFATDWGRIVTFGMYKAHVVTGGAFANTAWGKPHTVCNQPFDGGVQVVDPKTYVIEGRILDFRFFLWIYRLHEVNFDFEWT